MARNFTLNFPSTAFGPSSTTTGPTFVNHGTTPYSRIGLAFDDSADEGAATGMFAMPSEYTGTDTLKAKVYYYTASATSGAFACSIFVEAFTDGDTVDLEAAQGIDTGGNAGTATVPGTAGHLDVITITLSNKDSVAAGDLCRLLMVRDVSEDGVSGDVYLANIELYEET